MILARSDGNRLAYHRRFGKLPGVVFCGGFMSDMTGTKAQYLDAHCAARGRAYLRFDYLGHGASSGRFTDGTIGRWAEDAVAAIDALTEGPLVLAGSSMGGWIMLLAALARPRRVAGLVGVAAAPDFTEDLMWRAYPQAVRDQLTRDGVYHAPSAYDEQPYPITLGLIEDGRRHLLLRDAIPLACPVRLLHGLEDADVPWRLSLDLADKLASDDVVVTLVKGGDHRMSEPEQLARLAAAVDEVCDRAS